MGISIAIDSDGTPYATFRDVSASNKASLMRFDGSNWQFVGEGGFSAGIVRGLVNLSFDKNDTPYVLYIDDTSGKPTLMTYDGTLWKILGTPSFTSQEVTSASLALSPDNIPYVVAGHTEAFAYKFNTSASLSGPSEACEGATVTYSIPEQIEGATYSWSLPLGWSGSSSTNEIEVVPSNTGGTISVTSTSGCGTPFTSNKNVIVDCTVTSLTKSSDENETLQLWPNPTEESLTLQALYKMEEVIIYNVMGKEVFRKAVNSADATFNVSNLPAGIYYLQGEMNTVKFMKK